MASLWADRLAEVWAAPGRAAAGVVIGDIGVLTARHVIDGIPPGGQVLARVVQPGVSTAPWVPMRIAFASVDWDISVLIVDAASGQGTWAFPRSASPVFVRLGKTAERDCETVGFPHSAVQGHRSVPSAIVRQSEQALGTVLPSGHGKAPAEPHSGPLALMPLDVDSSTPLAQAEWAGMSGAGVVLPDGRLIGIVVQAEGGHQRRRLFLVPLADALDRDPALRSVLEFLAPPVIIEARHADLYRNALKRPSLGADGVPLRVDQIADLEVFGVRPAGVPDEPKYLAYAARDGDPELDRRLAEAVEQRRVLLVAGDSAAGKSRSAAEAIRRVLPGRRLLCPRSGDLSVITQLPLPDLMPTVVWLDDVDFFTYHDGLRENLQQLREMGIPVIATIRRVALEQLTSPGGVRNLNGEALCDNRFVDRVDWLLNWSSGEYSRMASKASASGLLSAIEDGIPVGVYCVAGPELLRRVDEARVSDDTPWRYAMLLAALDWYRTGIGVPAPLAVIQELMPQVTVAEGYPRHLKVDGSPAGEDVDDALRWFTSNVTGGRGRRSQQRVFTLLDAKDEQAASLSVHEYVLDHDHRRDRDRELRGEVWSAALRSAADDSAVFRIAAAADSQGRPDIALQAITPLADSGNSLAMCNMSSLLIRSDPTSAYDWAERALQSGDRETIPLAQNNLAVLLIRSGDMQRAVSLLETAVSSGDSSVVPLAQANLGNILINSGDTERARHLLNAAMNSGNPRAVTVAQAGLGLLLATLGDVEEARPLLEAAVNTADPQTLPMAQAGLGAVLVTLWDMDGARPLFEAAINSGDPLVLASARIGLGGVLAASGDTEGARPLLEAAVNSGYPLLVPRAQAALGALLMTSGDMDGARPLLEAAVSSRDPLAVPLAQGTLGLLLMTSGDMDGARPLLEAAMDSGNAPVVSFAQLGLGQMLMTSGDMDGARPLLEAAANSGHPVTAPVAQTNLATLLMLSGDVRGGITLLKSAFKSGNPQAVEMAQAIGEIIGLDLPGLPTPDPSAAPLGQADPLGGRELSATVVQALDRAASSVRPGEPLDTRNLFLALEASDLRSEWERLWLEAGNTEYRGRLELADPEPGPSGSWNSVSLTGTCTRALQVAVLIADSYGFRPVPAGAVALGLAADPQSGAAQSLMTGDLHHDALMELLGQITLGTRLNNLKDVLSRAIQASEQDDQA
jgi:tetratricopeptide (TPR) repeat protein